MSSDPSVYPAELDTLKADNEARLLQFEGTPDPSSEFGEGQIGHHAGLHNAVANAIMAIEKELGIEPSGEAVTVAARIKAIETKLGEEEGSLASQIKAIEEALAAVEASGVVSFKGRAGAVAPAANDYNVEQIEGLTAQLTGLTEAIETRQPKDQDLTDIAALAPEDGAIIVREGGKWVTLQKGELGDLVTFGTDGTVHRQKAPYLDPRLFGAKWDGSATDHTAVQEAINKSIERNFIPVVLPEGTGHFTQKVTVPKNLERQVKVFGMGKRRTTIKLEETLQAFGFAAAGVGDTIGNIDLQGFTVDGNNEQVAAPGTIPVIIGTNTNNQERVDIKNVNLEHLRCINVPTLEEQSNGRRAIVLQIQHKEPGLARNSFDNIDIHNIETTGQCGVILYGIGSNSPRPINVYFGKVHVSDIRYVGPQPAEAYGYSAGFQIGQYGWSDGKDVVIERIYSENSADVGVEIDVPCTARDIEAVNANNAGLLLNCFNPTTTTDPVVSKLTAEAAIGATVLTVTTAAGFSVGEPIVLYGADANLCQVRFIKAIAEGSIELTEALGLKYVAGTWISRVDVSGGRMLIENLRVKRTARTPGGERGLAIQNVENAIPAPAMVVNGYTYRRAYEGIPANQGEVVRAQYGTATSKSGNPLALEVTGMSIEIPNLVHSAAGKQAYSPFYLSMKGQQCPLKIAGEFNLGGAGVTGGGQLPINMIKLFGSALYDIDLLCSANLTSTGGEIMRLLALNDESKSGDLGGKARLRVRKSGITAGTLIQPVRYGKGNGFASSSIVTATTVKVEAGKTEITVESTAGFSAGDPIVLDSESGTAEIFVIEKIVGLVFTVVSIGETPGAVAEHAVGVKVARLNSNSIIDSDFSGLATGVSATPINTEDEKLRMRLLVKHTRSAKPNAVVNLAVPASGKAFQILQPGQSGTVFVEAGNVSSIEWSADGITFWKLAAGTGFSFHVSPGDFVKLTYTELPNAKFQADRT